MLQADERWNLRITPLMAKVRKTVYSTSESGGFTTVALDLGNTGLRYEYGDVVKVLLPNNDKTALCWAKSLSSGNNDDTVEYFTLEDMKCMYRDIGNGWGWTELWEALGWPLRGPGVPLHEIARYIEQGQIRSNTSNKSRWVNSPLDLVAGRERLVATPPEIPRNKISSLEPVSPRIYSVSGVETERVFLLVSKPMNGSVHHGYDSMADPQIDTIHCSFSPATFFLVPPEEVNLVCVASGTGTFLHFIC